MCRVGGCHYQGQVAYFLFLFIQKKVYSGVHGAHVQSQGHFFDATCYTFIFSSQLRVHEEKPDFLSD